MEKGIPATVFRQRRVCEGPGRGGEMGGSSAPRMLAGLQRPWAHRRESERGCACLGEEKRDVPHW